VSPYSQQWTQASGNGIAEPMSHWSLSPLVEPDLDGSAKVMLEGSRRRLRGFVVEDQDVAFGVEMKGAEVEVGRPNDRYVVVRY
jgi:hypothetical protein